MIKLKKPTFDIILFWGRPGAGKSEVIDFLKTIPVDERIKKFYIGEFDTIDDFEFLWEKGEEDDILQELGKERLYTMRHPIGYAITNDFLYDFLIKKINIKYQKFIEKNKDFFDEKTLFIEFSRGGGNAYTNALNLIHPDILKKSVAFYVSVSYQESIRKNKRRYNEAEKDSILQHSLPDFIMEKYAVDDWYDLISKNPDYINIHGIKIPHITFSNEPEKTDNPKEIEKHLLEILPKAYKNYF